MIKTRLIGLVPESKKYIAGNVLAQWMGLCASVVMIYTIVCQSTSRNKSNQHK